MQGHSIVDFSNSEVLNIAVVDVHLRIISIGGGVSHPDFLSYSLKSGLETPLTIEILDN